MSDKIGIRKQYHLAIVVKSKFTQNESKRLLKRDPSVLRVDYHWYVILLAFLIYKLRHLRHIMKVIAVFFSPCDHYFKIADWVENLMKTWLVLKAISKIIKSSSIHFPFKIPRRVVVCVRPIQTRLEWYRRHFSVHQLFLHQNAWPLFSNFDNIFESIRIIYCTAAPRKSNNLTNLLNIWHAKLE